MLAEQNFYEFPLQSRNSARNFKKKLGPCNRKNNVLSATIAYE